MRTIESLGWTKEEAEEIRASLLSFAQGWDAPGMEAYDEIDHETHSMSETEPERS